MTQRQRGLLKRLLTDFKKAFDILPHHLLLKKIAEL